MVPQMALCTHVVTLNSNRNVAYLNRNDHERNLNLNWFDDNDWNEIYRFAAVRKSIHREAAFASRRASVQSRRLAERAPRISSPEMRLLAMRS